MSMSPVCLRTHPPSGPQEKGPRPPGPMTPQSWRKSKVGGVWAGQSGASLAQVQRCCRSPSGLAQEACDSAVGHFTLTAQWVS